MADIGSFVELCMRIKPSKFCELPEDSRIEYAMHYIRNVMEVHVPYICPGSKDALELSTLIKSAIMNDLSAVYDMPVGEERRTKFNKIMDQSSVSLSPPRNPVDWMGNNLDVLDVWQRSEYISYEEYCYLLGTRIVKQYDSAESSKARTIELIRLVLAYPKSDELLAEMQETGQMQSEKLFKQVQKVDPEYYTEMFDEWCEQVLADERQLKRTNSEPIISDGALSSPFLKSI